MDEHRRRYIAAVARRIALAHGRGDEIEDYVSVAFLAYLDEVERRPDVAQLPLSYLGTIVSRRLTDWHREQCGRGAHRRKPHIGAASVEAMRDLGWEVPTECDVAEQAIEHVEPSSRVLIDLVLESASEKQRERTERILVWIAEGRTQAWVAEALGVTEGRVCQIVNQLGVAALSRRERYISC